MSRLCVCVYDLVPRPAGLSILERVGEGDAETKTVSASWWRHVRGVWGHVQTSTSLHCKLTAGDPAPKIASSLCQPTFGP